MKRFEFAWKTATSAAQNRDIMPLNLHYALSSVGVIFVVYITDVFAGINNINIAEITISAVKVCLRTAVNNSLNTQH